jgi:predicted phosphodiesterase
MRCLGDLVGYCALPRETLALLHQSAIPSVQGNHDLMAIGSLDSTGCGPNARAAIAWTRAVLSDTERAYLRSLPTHLMSDPTTILVHSRLGDPVSRLRSPADFLAEREVLRRFDPALRLCFTGHTHVPQITEVGTTGAISVHRRRRVRLHPSSFYFINPGSVGHPRQSDYRASYAIYDPVSGAVQLRQVAYDREAMRVENARHQIFTDLGPSVTTHRIQRALDRLRTVAGRPMRYDIEP